MVYFYMYASKLSLTEVKIQWMFSFTHILSITLELLHFHNVTLVDLSAMAPLVFSFRILSCSQKRNTIERRLTADWSKAMQWPDR